MSRESKLAFRKRALGPFFWMFLFQKLPLAFFAGVRLYKFDDEGATTHIKFGWINQNPFRSMYFAAMHMAAEFPSGLLLFQYMDKDTRFSMLLVETKAQFYKKAIGKISFDCNQGAKAESFIQSVLANEDGETIELPVEARNEEGELIAEFTYTWSCKRK